MRRPPTTDGSRDCDEETQYTITGPDQKFRKNDQKLPGNGNFKNELGKFLLLELGKDYYCNISGGKKVSVSYGDC